MEETETQEKLKVPCKEQGHLCQGRPNLHFLMINPHFLSWAMTGEMDEVKLYLEKSRVQGGRLSSKTQVAWCLVPTTSFTILMITLGKLSLQVLLINRLECCLPLHQGSRDCLQTLGYLVLSANFDKSVLATILPTGPDGRHNAGLLPSSYNNYIWTFQSMSVVFLCISTTVSDWGE